MRAMRLLVVEDDPLVSAAVVRVGRSMGHEVFTAGGVQAALDAVLETRPDAMLIDIGLGGPLDGRDLLSRMHRCGAARYVLTARNDDATAELCIAYGARNVWHKPASVATILRRIELDFHDDQTPRGRRSGQASPT
jgi:DNA-binding response OmpR family regulator